MFILRRAGQMAGMAEPQIKAQHGKLPVSFQQVGMRRGAANRPGKLLVEIEGGIIQPFGQPETFAFGEAFGMVQQPEDQIIQAGKNGRLAFHPDSPFLRLQHNLLQNGPAQTPGVGVAGVIDPALDAGVHLRPGALPGTIFQQVLAQPPPGRTSGPLIRFIFTHATT